MRLKSMTSKINKRFGVTLKSEEIALAVNEPDLKPADTIQASDVRVIEALVRLGKLPDTALRPEKVSVTDRHQPGSKLVLVAPSRRPKSQTDQDNLDWLEKAIAADRAMKAAEKDGRPYRPRHSASYSGGGYVYPDPFSHLLDPHEFSPFSPDGDTENHIYVTIEKMDVFQGIPEQSFQWRSREFLDKIARKLNGLWCAITECQQCGGELTVSEAQVKQLLRGELVLPETPGARRSQLLPYPRFCPWCLSLRKEKVHLEVFCQDMEGTEEEKQAARTEYYIEMLRRVTYQHEADGATTSIVIRSWREYQKRTKEMIQNVRQSNTVSTRRG